ncbi:PoNe immunity protein domain-containing protein [Streptococcus sp. 20925_1_22]|uniref:PoNe immunity protein domain-containing protein n=1 Tax=Streptococcus sp. 20925_1_22 TaxID=3003645 RepID=UPI0028D3C567|nr:PoNe immunity protein domain-containing protein [uncultured Streptococcus sp.]
MTFRDTLTTKDRILKLIDFEKRIINEKQKEINGLIKDTEEGVQRYKLTNDEVIANIKGTINVLTEEILVATYTAGYPLEDFKEEYINFVNSLLPVWQSNSGYLQMVWVLSIGILLEINDEIFDQLVDLVKKDDPEDYLIDYLIQSRHPDWKIRINYNFPRPYGFTRKIIEEENAEQALKLLKEYVTKKWYPGHRDTGWYDLHKANIDNYYGYWSFESGALCKLKGLDYKELEGVPYFPYDLVAEGAEV